MNPELKTLRDDVLLLITALIWGLAFTAQRVGMEYIGPFMFNGLRFALGAASLIPLIFILERKKGRGKESGNEGDRMGGKGANPVASRLGKSVSKGQIFLYGGAAGTILFIGASLQQIGIVYTTAGKAGFITGLYVVIVPIMGLVWRQRSGSGRWIGAVLAITGLYFLSVTKGFSIRLGDFLVFLSAFFWAAHVHVISLLSKRVAAITLSAVQFATCALLSLIVGLVFEDTTGAGVSSALVPILYGGLGSVGIAYTLQVIAQKEAHPAHAAIILSLEGVFAVLGGWLFIGEVLTLRGVLGCALMLTGMLVSQLSTILAERRRKRRGSVLSETGV